MTKTVDENPEADRVLALYAKGEKPNFNMLYFAATENWQHDELPEVDGTPVEWNADVSNAVLITMRALAKLGALNMEGK